MADAISTGPSTPTPFAATLMVANFCGTLAATAASPFTVTGCRPAGPAYVDSSLMNSSAPAAESIDCRRVLRVRSASHLIGAGAADLAGSSPAGLQHSCDPNPPHSIHRLRPLRRHGRQLFQRHSVYHGLTANLRKRFSNHYEFLASYTWSHSIDDSTDLQSTLTPQDSYSRARSRQVHFRPAPSFCLQRRLPDWQAERQRLRE